MFLHPHCSNRYCVSTEVIHTMSNAGAIFFCLNGNSKLSQQIKQVGIPILFISSTVSLNMVSWSSQVRNKSHFPHFFMEGTVMAFASSILW